MTKSRHILYLETRKKIAEILKYAEQTKAAINDKLEQLSLAQEKISDCIDKLCSSLSDESLMIDKLFINIRSIVRLRQDSRKLLAKLDDLNKQINRPIQAANATPLCLKNISAGVL